MEQETTTVILYAYPYLRALAEASGAAAENKARLSFRCRLDTLDEMVRIAEELAVRCALLRLAEAADAFVAACNAEERFLLEYRYFRRGGKGTHACAVPCSERTYYRRQNALLKKAAAYFAAHGWRESEYFAAFSAYAPFARLLRTIRSGRESALVTHREKRRLRFRTPAPSAGDASRAEG